MTAARSSRTAHGGSIAGAMLCRIGLCCIGLCGAARASDFDVPARLQLPDSLLPLREMYPDLRTPAAAVPSSKEFLPRVRAAWEIEPRTQQPSAASARSLQSTSAWQRLADFKSRNSVRLLTLWESSGSTVSLQAGKHGSPSLQWTSRSMNRGGASRGLLDSIFALAPHGARETPAALAPTTGAEQGGGSANTSRPTRLPPTARGAAFVVRNAQP